MNFEKNIDTSFNKEEYKEFLYAILLGDTEKLNIEIKNNFRDANLSHILAISGMHIGYIIIGINSILKCINSKKLRNFISLVVLLIFVILIGCSPSSIRAYIMFVMSILASNFCRKSNTFINLNVALIIILIINPLYIENIGVWLSFGGTIRNCFYLFKN